MKTCYTDDRTVSTPIERLRELLGKDVLLLHWPLGTKGTPQKWGHLTIEAMNDPRYLEKLATGNVGVALGQKSNGLCAIDLDRDELVEPFLATNPKLTATLQTHGARGRVFWVRILGEYPPNKKLKRNGEALGEWRADGLQSIVAGIHPATQQPYRFVNEAKPVEIAFGKIVWPEGVSLREKPTESKSSSQCGGREPASEFTHDAHDSQESDDLQELKVVKVCRVCGDLSGATEDEIVALCVPNRAHENNARLFDLARGVKTLERERGQEYSERDLKRVFGRWFRKSRPCLRAGQTRAQYWDEFLRGGDVAQVALDEGGLLTAWQQTKKSEPPEWARVFKSAAGRMLVSLCWQLQKLAGEHDFFLSCYSAGKLLQVTPVHTASLLRALVAKGVLRIVEKGCTGKATRYRFTDNPKPKTLAL